jgi:hypothetical protein
MIGLVAVLNQRGAGLEQFFSKASDSMQGIWLCCKAGKVDDGIERWKFQSEMASAKLARGPL